MPKPKKEETGLFQKLKVRSSKGLTHSVVMLMGFSKFMMKASCLPISKVRQFLRSKPSYTKFTLVTREIRRTKAFASFKKENQCLDLAYINRMSKKETK